MELMFVVKKDSPEECEQELLRYKDRYSIDGLKSSQEKKNNKKYGDHIECYMKKNSLKHLLLNSLLHSSIRYLER